jgi:hypothetical protein
MPYHYARSGLRESQKLAGSFTAGVIFINLPDDTSAKTVSARILQLIEHRLPESLLGAVTMVKLSRALSQIVRRRL